MSSPEYGGPADTSQGRPADLETGEQGADEPTLGELLAAMQEQTARLVRAEFQLAQAEMRQKGVKALLGAGMFGAAGMAGLFAAGALVAAAILGLAVAIDPWLAALAVGGVLAAAAGTAALIGFVGVKQSLPLVPERALTSISEDLSVIKPAGRP